MGPFSCTWATSVNVSTCYNLMLSFLQSLPQLRLHHFLTFNRNVQPLGLSSSSVRVCASERRIDSRSAAHLHQFGRSVTTEPYPDSSLGLEVKVAELEGSDSFVAVTLRILAMQSHTTGSLSYNSCSSLRKCACLTTSCAVRL